MSAFLTILIWFGSGFAFAAGFFIGIWIVGKRNSDWNKSTEEANSLMRERNGIDRQSVQALRVIAEQLQARNQVDLTVSQQVPPIRWADFDA